MKIKDISKTSKIAILGFGKEGKSSLNFLKKIGFSHITILDSNSSLSITKCPSILGETYLDSLSEFDVIIKSPGISPYNPEIFQYKEKCISQTQIFFEFYAGKIIGITGTKGKSTVSTLVHTCLKKLGYTSKLVGNIGKPVLDEIDVSSSKTYDYVVYELSSYMLEGFAPNVHIGYINNIHPCHLDWHTSMDIYTTAKYNILKNAEHSIVHNSLSGGTYTFPDTENFYFQEGFFYKGTSKIFDDSGIQLLGEHNRINICGVLTILNIIEPNINKLTENTFQVLQDFSPLAHRLENIGTYNDITFIDDGIAVTPDATIAAIQSTVNLKTLLTGGKDIGMNQEKLEENIKNSTIENIVLFPETGYDLFSDYTKGKDEEISFEFICSDRKIKALKTRSMQSAVEFAFINTGKGGSVLLSSAAQSYSLWKNFEEKGKEYKQYIEYYASI